MEEAPVAEVRPVKRVTMYEAMSATMEDGRRTKTATVDRHPTTSEPSAAKGSAASTEAAAMKCRSATAEATAMETAAATAAETTAAAAETAATAAAVLNLGSQSIGCKFR